MRRFKNLIRKSKLRMLVLAVTAIAMPLGIAAQEARLTLPDGKLTPEQVFDLIHKQTPYRVTANMSRVSGIPAVKMGKANAKVSEVLGRMLQSTGYTYAVDGEMILLPLTATEAAATSAGSVVAVHAVRTVAGTVTETAGGSPLENVAVEILGVDDGKTTTNTLGRFTVAGVPSGNRVVKLTSPDGELIRYREITVPASGDSDFSFSMGGEAVSQAVSAGSDPAITKTSAPKTTAYYVPNPTDHTVRAFADEPKAEYGFIPYEKMRETYYPRAAVKTNLLYLATTTLNVGAEFGLGRKWTLDVAAGLNPWDLNERNGGIRHWFVQPEVRYWFCQRFEKHFIGLHALGGGFQIMDIDLQPLGDDLTGKRYDGWGAGGGVSYGYHLPMGKRWAWEFTVGAGYVYLEYDKYECGACDRLIGNKGKHYLGPTKAGISLIYMIK